ncbi:MAG: S8/S53 family peptidase [Elusimicrobia bacterium]|nr:S8/S53 family peptidase [Elusimicrobiota bacterium]
MNRLRKFFSLGLASIFVVTSSGLGGTQAWAQAVSRKGSVVGPLSALTVSVAGFKSPGFILTPLPQFQGEAVSPVVSRTPASVSLARPMISRGISLIPISEGNAGKIRHSESDFSRMSEGLDHLFTGKRPGKQDFRAVESVRSGSVIFNSASGSKGSGSSRGRSSNRGSASKGQSGSSGSSSSRKDLLARWKGLMESLQRSTSRITQLEGILGTHNIHAALERDVAAHNEAAAETRGKIDKEKERLSALNRELSQVNAALREVGYPLKSAVGFEAVEGASQASGWDLPDSPGSGVGKPQPNPNNPIKGVPGNIWKKFYGRGFDLSVEGGKPVRVVGRWTERELDLGKLGLWVGLKEEKLQATYQGNPLSEEDFLKWLEIAEMFTLEKLPEPPPLNESEKKIGLAGAKLYSWGVPPHVLNSSMRIQYKYDPEKHRAVLDPHVFLYTFKQGMPMATPEGLLMVQFLEKLGKEKAKLLTPIELHSLAYLFHEQVVPWSQYSPEGAQKVLDQLFERFEKGKVVGPLLADTVGIDMENSPFDLAQNLRAGFEQFRNRMTVAVVGNSDKLDFLLGFAQAIRFAWTVMSPDPKENNFRAVTHRDGISYMKFTGWANARFLWRFLPLGQTFLYMGLDKAVEEIVQREIRGRPMGVADAGWADPTHPDLVKDVVLLDRSGNVVSLEEVVSGPQDISAPPVKKDSEGKEDAKDEKDKATVRTGREYLRVDSHATAVATPMALAAQILGTQVFSVDLPGFRGDLDVVPPGVDPGDHFYQEFERAMTAAIEKGAAVFNFSWGGPPDSRLHKFLDEMHEKRGVLFTDAFGNSGPGFLGQGTSPSYANSIVNVGGEDGMGRVASFTSAGGFAQTWDGNIRFMPTLATPAGFFGANGTDRITENPDLGMNFFPGSNGRYVFVKGTSFSDPIHVTQLSMLAAIVEHEAKEFLSGKGVVVTSEGLRGLAKLSLGLAQKAFEETAEMLPGEPAFYQGQGRTRYEKARQWVQENLKSAITQQGFLDQPPSQEKTSS